MEKLIQNLKDQTVELLDLYVEKSKEYAEKEWNYSKELIKWSDIKWCEYFGIEPVPSSYICAGPVAHPLGFPRNFHNTERASKRFRMRNKAQNIAREQLSVYIIKAQMKAEAHFSASIEKLAYRIVKKGLDKENITLRSSRVGMNFETLATDGKMIVRAFTILAWGEKNAPHYRYLVK